MNNLIVKQFNNEEVGFRINKETGESEVRINEVAKFCGWSYKRTDRKNDIEHIRWNTVNKYLVELGVATCSDNDFIPEYVMYPLIGKAKNDRATKFMLWAGKVLVEIRKTGGYILPRTYGEALMELAHSVKAVETLQEENTKKDKELNYRNDLIVGLTKEIPLAERRQYLNRVIRRSGSDNIANRWRELYKQFDMKYHMDTKLRLENYNKKHAKNLTRLDYVWGILDMTDELYEVACKIYESDFNELMDEMFSLR